MLFTIVNLGCKVNRVESDAVAAELLRRGWSEAPLEAADLVVVNTCTVTGEADKKTRKAVRHAARMNPIAPIVVTGCAAAINPTFYQAIDPRVLIVSKPELMAAVAEQVHLMGDGRSSSPSLDLGDMSDSAFLRAGDGFRTRVGVKVQDGCNNACTYCIVHVARGRSTSRDAEAVIRESAALAAAGVREIVLTGINLGCFRGSYGGREIGLAGLLEILLDGTKEAEGPGAYPVRFRIGSIEPRNVDDALIEVMANAEGRIARHLHLPLQSGSSKVLRDMARPYDRPFFEDLVSRLRDRVPSMALSTDIIAGFPGETEEDFAETLEVARNARFMKIHAFPYSLREGTPAAARTDQIAPEVKAERAERLRALSDELAALDLSSRRGTTELALVESCGIATLESYHTVSVSDTESAGALVPVTL